MVFLFKNTNGPITWGAVSNIIPTPITGLTATSTVAGQIVLTWSGGIGQNVKYTYALSTGTVQSIGTLSGNGVGIPYSVTLTLTTTNSVTTTVTLTATVIGGSTSVVSNSVTTLVTSFSNNCSSLTGWTNSSFTVTTTGGQTGFYGNGTTGGLIYISTGFSSFKGKTLIFNVYLTGGCPELIFGSNSAGTGTSLRFEQRFSGNQNGFSNSSTWGPSAVGTQSYTWTQNTWLAITIPITSVGVASLQVNGTTISAITSFTMTNDGGYIGFNADGGGGSISVNNITVT